MDPIDIQHYSRALGQKVRIDTLACAEDPFSTKCSVRIGDDEGRYLDMYDAKAYLDKRVELYRASKNLEVEKEPDTMLSVLQEIRDLLKERK